VTRVVVVLALVACGRRSEEPLVQPPDPPPADARVVPGSQKLGESCGPAAACTRGLVCWTTARCELACGDDQRCPEGTTCVTGVCRRR
jgi:hypothetical protein